MRRIIIVFEVLALFFLFINCLPILCQEVKPKKIHVSLEVTGDNKNIVYSYLTRELRSLNDVVIEDKDGRYELIFVVLEPHYKAGKKTGGIIIATAILDNYYKNVLKIIVAIFVKDKQHQETLNSSIDSLTSIRTLFVNSGSKDDLKQICEDIITKIDIEYLEEVRKSIRNSKNDSLNY